MAIRTFREELKHSPANTPLLALHAARNIAYPNLSIPYYLSQLDTLAEEVRELLDPLEPVATQAKMLADFLFQEQGFRGNTAEYNDPRNSFFNDLLDRRLGIPITLSVLYLAIANRVRIPAYGVGLPGHFIVGVRDSLQIEDILLDPFHNGVQLSIEDCKRLVQETAGITTPFQRNWLRPSHPLDILARMLNNLRIVYVQRQWWAEAIIVTEHLRLVQPDMPELLRDLGLIYYHQKAPHQAAHYLELYLQKLPNAVDASAIQEALKGMLDDWARYN